MQACALRLYTGLRSGKFSGKYFAEVFFMKKRLLTGFLIALIAVLCSTALFACAERTDTDDPIAETQPTEQEETSATYRTLEILNGTDRSVKTYVVGDEIHLKAELSATGTFVCWISQGVPFSYDRETTYVVEKDAVVQAVYTSVSSITFDTDGGTLPEFYRTSIRINNTDALTTDSVLFSGYGYALPVPTKPRYRFTGWAIDGVPVTDENGVSLSGVTFDERKKEFTAVYEEKEYVMISLLTTESEEADVVKVYLEDGSYLLNAPEIPDRECVGIYAGEEELTKGAEEKDVYRVQLAGLETGRTYSYICAYREAYKLTIISGVGSGLYQLGEEIPISAQVTVGNEFKAWTVEINGKTYTLGSAEIDGEKKAAINDGQKTYVYADGGVEETAAAFVPADEEDSIRLSDLQKLGMPVSGGANTVVTAIFRRKDYEVTYIVECYVDGTYCLTAEEEATFESEEYGFVKYDSYEYGGKTYKNCYVKQEYYNFKELIVLSSVPSVAHYKFGNWQNVKEAESVPASMPNGNVCVRGTFAPERHRIEVGTANREQGSVHIFATGTATNGYFNYGSTIDFYVTANWGYEFLAWWDIAGASADERITMRTEDKETDNNVYYVYSYKVTGDEVFTVNFIEREYEITYRLKVVYDGEDVTESPDFFEDGAYVDGYWETKETRRYNARGALKAKETIKGDETPDGLALLYGADNWTVTEWTPDGVSIGSTSNFLMPRQNFTVLSTCEINYYNVNFSKQAGVSEYALNEVNGSPSEKYVSKGSAGYDIPYGATMGLTVTYDTGYSVGAVGLTNGEILGDGEEFRTEGTDNRYVTNVFFEMLQGKSTSYLIHATHNSHTILFYVAYDHEHTDEENLLSDYIRLDGQRTKTIGEKTYYEVKSVRSPKTSEMTDINVYKIYYNSDIEEPAIDATKERYSFSGWRRMLFNEEYNQPNMPDDSLWMYGDLTLKTYSVSIGRSAFRFDGQEGVQVDTAFVREINEDNESVEYTSSRKYLYFSSFTFAMRDPTGYDYKNWRLTTTVSGAEPIVTTFDATESTVGEVETIRVNGKTYKYRRNDDDTITVFLTEDITIDVLYEIKHFTATFEDTATYRTLSLKTNKTGAQYKDNAITFDFGDQIVAGFNCDTITKSGKKLDAFLFCDAEGNTLQSVSANFDEDTLRYGTSDSLFVSKQSSVRDEQNENVNGFTSDVKIRLDVSAIQYRLTYRIYERALNLSSLGGDYIDVTHDLDGNLFTVGYNETSTLIDDATTKALAAAGNLDSTNAMYSGWYIQSDLNYTDSEGMGFSGTAGAYNQDQSTYKHTKYREHALVCCYLIRLYRIGNNGNLALNPIIKNTPQYKSHLGYRYSTLSVPGVDDNGNPITTLDANAFENASVLKHVTLHQNITTIGEGAFRGCTALEESVVTPYVTTIGAYAFQRCNSITSVTIYNALEEIGANAFADMQRLETVEYRKTRTALTAGQGVFKNAGSNLTLIIGKETTVFPGSLFNAVGNETSAQTLKTVKMEEGETIVTIANGAFAGSGLTTFIASSRLSSIGDGAFSGCNYLDTFDLTAAKMTMITSRAFETSGLKTIILPRTLTEIQDRAFYGCTYLESVYYTNANGISAIGANAFRRYDGVEEQNLKRVTSINNKAAVDEDDTLYREIRLENVKTIGAQAFDGARYVETIILGGAVSSFANTVFSDATEVTDVYYNVESGANGLETAQTFAQMRARNPVTVHIGEAVRNVPNYAFYGFDSATTLIVPENVKRIGTRAFGSMTGLQSVQFNVNGDDEDVNIANNAYPFIASGNNMVVTFGENVTRVLSYMFYGANGLMRAVVPEATNKDFLVEEKAFARSGIQSMEVPARNSFTLEAGAFENAALSSLTVSEDVGTVTLGAGTLSGVTGALTLNVFGRTLTALPVALSSGTFVVEQRKNAQNVTEYYGTMNGQMQTSLTEEFILEQTDHMTVLGTDSYLRVQNRATVKGSLTKAGDAVIESVSSASFEYFRAIAYSGDDFLTKNELSAYTHLQVPADTTFGAENAVVRIGTLEVNGTLTLSGNTSILSTAVNVDALGDLIDDGKITATMPVSALTGRITVNPYKTLIISGRGYFCDDRDVDETLNAGKGYGFSVQEGTAGLVGAGARGVTYDIPAGATVYIPRTLTMTSNESLVLAATATLSTAEDIDATLQNYQIKMGSFVTVNDGTKVEFLARTSLNLMAEVAAKLHADTTIGSTINARGVSQTGNTVLYADDDMNLTQNVTFPYSLTINLNGYSMQTSGKIIADGTLTLRNADVTGTSASSETIQAVGFVLASGKIETVADAIVADSLTIESTASVKSTQGTALTASTEANVYGTTEGANGLDIVMGSASAMATITGAMTATNGFGIRASASQTTLTLNTGAAILATGYGILSTGDGSAVTVKNGATVTSTGGTGIDVSGKHVVLEVLARSVITGHTKGVVFTESGLTQTDIDNNAKLTDVTVFDMAASASITGASVGLQVSGPGTYNIAGTITANHTRAIAATGYAGAIVAEESDIAGNYMKATVSGTVTNDDASGDAIVYVGYNGVETKDNAFAPMTATAATLTGDVCEVMTCYGDHDGNGLYYAKRNGEMSLFSPKMSDSPAGNRYVYVARTARVVRAGNNPVLADRSLDGFVDAVRLVISYANVADAMAAGADGVFRVTDANASIGTDVGEKTTIVASNAEISFGEDIELSGRIVMIGKKLNATKKVTVKNGGDIVHTGKNNAASEAVEISDGGEICLENGARMFIYNGSDGESPMNIYGAFKMLYGATVGFESAIYAYVGADWTIQGAFNNLDSNGIPIGGIYFNAGSAVHATRVSETDTISVRAFYFENGSYDINVGLVAKEDITLGDKANVSVEGPIEAASLSMTDTSSLRLYGYRDDIIDGEDTLHQKHASAIATVTNGALRGNITLEGSAALSIKQKTLNLYGNLLIRQKAMFELNAFENGELVTGVTLNAYGRITLDGETRDDVASLLIGGTDKAGKLNVGASGTYQGRLVVKGWSVVNVPSVIVKDGMGMEYYSYGFEYKEKGAKLYRGYTSIPIGGIHIDANSWVYAATDSALGDFSTYKNGYNEGGVSNKEFLNDAGDGYEQRKQKVYGYRGEELGYIVTYYATADLSEYGKIAATEANVGYVAPKATKSVTLSTGMNVRIDFAASAIVPPTEEHTYEDTGNGTHICSVCGLESAHVFGKTLGQTRSSIDVDGENIIVLAYICSECLLDGTLALYPRTYTVGGFNNAGYIFGLSGGNGPALEIKGTYDDDTPLSAVTPIGQITIEQNGVDVTYDVLEVADVTGVILIRRYGILIPHRTPDAETDGYAASETTGITGSPVLVYGSEGKGYEIVLFDLDTDDETAFTARLTQLQAELGEASITVTASKSGKISDQRYVLATYMGTQCYLHDGLTFLAADGTETTGLRILVHVNEAADTYGYKEANTSYSTYSPLGVERVTEETATINFLTRQSTGQLLVLSEDDVASMSALQAKLATISLRLVVRNLSGDVVKMRLYGSPAVSIARVYNSTSGAYENVSLGNDVREMYSMVVWYDAATNSIVESVTGLGLPYNVVFVKFSENNPSVNGQVTSAQVFGVLIPHEHPKWKEKDGYHACVQCGQTSDVPHTIEGYVITDVGGAYARIYGECDTCHAKEERVIVTTGTRVQNVTSALNDLTFTDEAGNVYTLTVRNRYGQTASSSSYYTSETIYVSVTDGVYTINVLCRSGSTSISAQILVKNQS